MHKQPHAEDRVIRQALAHADQSLGDHGRGPPDIASLKRAVVRRSAKRRRRTSAGAMALLLSLAAATWLSSRRRPPPLAEEPRAAAADAPADVAALLAEVAALTVHVERHERVVAAISHHRRIETTAGQLAQLAATAGDQTKVAQPLWQRETDRAAITSLVYAEHLAVDPKSQQLAASEYRRVQQRFPGTIWSKAAEDSLAALESM